MKRIVAVVFVLLVVLVGAFAFNGKEAERKTNASMSLVELQVDNMTCGSCVASITKALDSVSGVETIDISVTTGTGKVAFDPLLVTPEQLTDVITEAGYPASVKQLLSTEQYHALQNEEMKLAASYVARIGDQLISKQAFQQQLAPYLKNGGGNQVIEKQAQAYAQAWQAILQKTLLLQAAVENQVVLQPGEVDLRIAQMQKSMPNLDTYALNRYGSMENFKRQLKEDMVISRNIDDFVISGIDEPRLRQQALDQWFQSLVKRAEVVIYDQQLKQALGGSGGCGGCC